MMKTTYNPLFYMSPLFKFIQMLWRHQHLPNINQEYYTITKYYDALTLIKVYKTKKGWCITALFSLTTFIKTNTYADLLIL